MSGAVMEIEGFAASRRRFESILGLLASEEAGGLSHGELEEQLEAEGRKLLRELLQDHLTLRRLREQRLQHVIDAQGVGHSHVEIHERKLGTVFPSGVVAVPVDQRHPTP